jgi:hypothetical protein
MEVFMEPGAVAQTIVDFSSVDFSAITATISAGVPVVMPIVVTLVGLRKGISFVMGMVRGA